MSAGTGISLLNHRTPRFEGRNTLEENVLEGKGGYGGQPRFF